MPKTTSNEGQAPDAEFALKMEQAFQGKPIESQPQDVYIEHLLESLPPELIQSMTDEQYLLLKRAFLRHHTRHMMDIRGVVPFFFTQFYFVFLFGKDRRQATQQAMADRRSSASEGASRLGGLLATSAFLLGLFFISLGLLYFLKTVLKVDLIPDFHLPDLWR
ncbi:MAG: hypothetical protein KIT45_12500 [Fimbriimonadia bacterium]|nr:hypothetical protein [Fimbriimonadia bacterium]